MTRTRDSYSIKRHMSGPLSEYYGYSYGAREHSADDTSELEQSTEPPHSEPGGQADGRLRK